MMEYNTYSVHECMLRFIQRSEKTIGLGDALCSVIMQAAPVQYNLKVNSTANTQSRFKT
jgi:hypothetical protein